MTRGLRRLGVLAAAAAMASVTATGCGGTDEPAAAPTQEPDQSGLSSGETSGESPSESTDLDDYLPVPEGVRLTPQGTELALKGSAVVAWEPRQDLVGVLDVTVSRLKETRFAESFQGWQLDATTRKSTPYFVRATVANVGETDVGGRDVPLYAVDATDTLIEASGFQTRFDPCPGNGIFPQRFGPGDATDICLVYLVPEGGKLTAVSFRPSQDFDPITWTGLIERNGKPGRR